MQFVAWLCGQGKGNAVELGCNYGLTSLQICANNPRLELYGVDYVDSPLDGPQIHEQPKGVDQIGLHARKQSNFHPLNVRSAEVDYAALPHIGKIFVDADHKYASVKADSDHVLEFLRTRSCGIIIWHDCYDAGYNQDWSQVRQYLEAEVEPTLPLYKLANSAVAFGLVGNADSVLQHLP